MKHNALIFLIMIVLFQITIIDSACAQNITVTVVGGDFGGTGSDGASGLVTRLSRPRDICVDGSGNIYFTDDSWTKIKKMSARNGVVSTIGGGGKLLIDGVPATAESLALGNIACDVNGNIFFGSKGEVKRIDAVTDIITTAAGGPVSGFAGDGGPATMAKFNGIWGIGVDGSGSIYVVDALNYRIRKIDVGTSIVSTIAGTGSRGYTGDGGPATVATLNWPSFLCVSSGGDVFFEDTGGGINKFRKISAASGIISLAAGGTTGSVYDYPATATYLDDITGICVDASGNLFFNESSCTCRKMDILTDSVYLFAGQWASDSYKDDTDSKWAFMNTPCGLARDNLNNLFVADFLNNRIRKIIPLTHVPTFAYGKGQFINPCTNVSYSLDRPLTVVDIDYYQFETWTVLSGPAHGSLAGFPCSRLSWGTFKPTAPVGMFYTPGAGYSGDDSFRVQVSDGTFADTITIYVSVSAPPPGGVISSLGGHSVCAYTTAPFSDTVIDGSWSVTDNTVGYVDTMGVWYAYTKIGIDTILYTHPFYRCTVVDSYSVYTIAAPSVGAIIGGSSVCAGTSIVLSDTTAGGKWRAANGNATVSVSGVVTGISSGTDLIYFADSNKCGGSEATKLITIDSIPVVAGIIGSDSVCVGASVPLSDTVLGGAWSASNTNASVSGSGLVTGVTQGLDVISYSVGNACGVTSVTTTITVNPLPYAGTITGESAVCLGATVYLVDPAPGGIWTETNSNGSISSGGVFVPMLAGVDTVLYSVYNSCGAAYSSQVITITDCEALNSTVYPRYKLSLFPNPASSVLNVEWSGWSEYNQVLITDIAGRELLRNDFVKNASDIKQVDISNLSSGIYLVKVNGGEVRKFVKN